MRVSLLQQVRGDLEVLVRVSLPMLSVGWTLKVMLTNILCDNRLHVEVRLPEKS